MIKTFKTQLVNVSAEQTDYFNRAIGIRRWAWNWAVETYFNVAGKEEKYLTDFQLQKIMNNTLVQDPDYVWLTEVNSMVRQEAFKDFHEARVAWLKHVGTTRKTAKLVDTNKGKPRFKKRGKGVESFRYMSKGTPLKVVSDHKMTLTRVRGLKPLVLQTSESVAFLKKASIKTITINRNGGKFFISVTYEIENLKPRRRGTGKVGIDMGISHVSVTYDGTNTKVFDLPPTLRVAEKKTERINRILARTKKNSSNHNRVLQRLQRSYAREANIKKDFREKLTTFLVSSYDTINLESFAFESAKQLDINRALHRVSPYAFAIRLKQKAEERGVTLVEVPKGTPTTQTCSACGHVQAKKLELKDRVFACEVCLNTLDRDKNAARNIYKI